jgi:hypothetical protein
VHAGPMLRYGRRVARELEQLLRGVDHPVARALVTPRRVLASGPEGTWTRSDHRKALLGGGAAFIIGWTIALGIFALADQHAAGSRWNTVLSGAGLFFMLGGSYLGWKGLQHLRAALRGPSAPSS